MKEPRNVKSFRRPADAEGGIEGLSTFSLAPAAVPPDFVAKVMRGLPESVPERPGAWLAGWKWAAALLIFSAALGYGFSVAEETADSVASIASTPVETEASILVSP